MQPRKFFAKKIIMSCAETILHKEMRQNASSIKQKRKHAVRTHVLFLELWQKTYGIVIFSTKFYSLCSKI